MNKKRVPLTEIAALVKREVKNRALLEDVDHEQISSVVAAASKLAVAIKKFQEKAPASAVGSIASQLDAVKTSLDDMASNPGSYVAKQKKVVKLTPAK